MTVMEKFGTARKVDISTIVLPVDFSPLSWQVLPLAAHVARRFHAQLRPIHVDTASPWRDESEAALRLRATAFGRPVTVTVVASPDPVTGITHFAGSQPRSLTAMSSHGHSGFGEIAFGSVCEGVLRSADATILTAGPKFDVERHAFIRRVIATVDMTTGGESILPEAFGWARALDVPFELITVLPQRPGSDRIEQEQQARFARLVSDLGAVDPRVTGLVLRGARPAHEIVRHVAALRGTLLAMSTHARPMVARTIVGSTAASVLRHSPTGLLLSHRVT
jgi:nucleotide-binding universal stress UspA family protein